MIKVAHSRQQKAKKSLSLNAKIGLVLYAFRQPLDPNVGQLALRHPVARILLIKNTAKSFMPK